MSCYFPLYRLPEEVAVTLLPSRYHHRIHNKGLMIKKIEYDQLVNYVPAHLWQQVPCGMCVGCRTAYAREWAIRCLMEEKFSTNSLFLTLTYDNEHLPVKEFYDPRSGEIYSRGVLVKRDFQLFMKRLRLELPEGVRFMASGEFGELYKRPHFHAILFNAPIDDLKISVPAEANNGNALYDSDLVRSTWKNGNISVGEVNYGTCAYVAGYVQKKEKGFLKAKAEARDEMLKRLIPPDTVAPAPIETLADRQPFLMSSRRPGIGRKYYDDHIQDIYERDSIIVKYKEDVQNVQPSRYYDRLYDIDHHEELQAIKKKRREDSQYRQGQTLALTDLSAEEYNMVQYHNAMAKQEKLHRDHLSAKRVPHKSFVAFRDLW